MEVACLGGKSGLPRGRINKEVRRDAARCPLTFMSWSFPRASQVLIQGCLLDPSQREVFLQQVYAQLCLFEDKVATMLQQQYDPQSQVCGRQSSCHLERAAVKEQRGERRGKPNSERKELKKRARGRASRDWKC